jgi:hypothetical protein
MNCLPNFFVLQAHQQYIKGSKMTAIVIRRPYAFPKEEHLKAFGGNNDVDVIVDRRFDDRQTHRRPVVMDRRAADRRRPVKELVQLFISL